MSVFDNLGTTPENTDFEMVEDSRLACQECGKINTSGRYFEKEELLTWRCICGHTSKLNVRL